MAELKPKRGFVNVEDWHRIGQDRNPVPRIWDERRAVGDDIPVLVIPDPDRDPTPEEIEALGQLLCPDAPLSEWRNVTSIARAAWRLGARVPS